MIDGESSVVRPGFPSDPSSYRSGARALVQWHSLLAIYDLYRWVFVFHLLSKCLGFFTHTISLIDMI